MCTKRQGKCHPFTKTNKKYNPVTKGEENADSGERKKESNKKLNSFQNPINNNPKNVLKKQE